MKRLLLMATLVASTLVFAQNDDWKSKGELLYVEKGCIGCHGVAGIGTAYAPPLAGLNADYIVEQLEDFQDGTRMNLTMEVMALQAEGVENLLAAYLATRCPRKPLGE